MPPVTGDASVLIVPAFELAPLVNEYRVLYAPDAAAGVPPHVTILAPFAEPSLLSSRTHEEVDELFAPISAFDYSVTSVREFAGGTLYLAPEPAGGFITLTRRVSKRFRLKPYGGAFASIVPHVTVAQLAPDSERARIRARLARALPVVCHASEVWLMVGSNSSGWRTVHVTPFAENHGGQASR